MCIKQHIVTHHQHQQPGQTASMITEDAHIIYIYVLYFFLENFDHQCAAALPGPDPVRNTPPDSLYPYFSGEVDNGEGAYTILLFQISRKGF